MSAKHTPGPWRVHADRWIKATRGEHEGEILAAPTYWMEGGEAVAAEGRANARLIAAAPELLEALTMAREMIATERQSFADCNNVPELTAGDDPDNFVSIGGALFEQHDAHVVADYDRALAQIDAAIAKAAGSAS